MMLAYVANDPVNKTDPSGNSITELGFLVYDVASTVSDVAHGASAGEIINDAVNIGLDVEPIPGLREVKGAVEVGRAVEHGVEAARAVERGAGNPAVREAAAAGRAAHRDWNAGQGFRKEVTLANGKRADAVNFETRHVKELKPDNPRAIARGEKQVEGYRQQLEKQTGEKFTCSVETYCRK